MRNFILFIQNKLHKRKVVLALNSRINSRSVFEGNNKIGKKTIFSGRLGYGSYIGSNCNISAKIGKYCSIANDVVTITATHPLNKFVSTHPTFYSLLKQNGTTFTKTQRFNEFLYSDIVLKYGVIIGNDVWIGAGATILGGVSIGDGAVILANATVTKDVIPYAIVGGVPAKTVKKRFNDETINYLLEVKWWNMSDGFLAKNVDIFEDIDTFRKMISLLDK